MSFYCFFSTDFYNAGLRPAYQAFRLFTCEIAREYILLPSPQHRDPLNMVKIHYRRPKLSREQLQQRLLDHHAALVMAQPAPHSYVQRYAQLHNIGSTQQPDPEGSPTDAISVRYFASVNDVEDYLATDDYQTVEADGATFIDLARSAF